MQIDALFCRPGYYQRAPHEEIAALEGERAQLQAEMNRRMEAGETVERRLEVAR